MASTPKTTLLSKTTHLQSLLSHFTTSLTANPPSTPPPIESPNPLPILRDASHLLKAQTTKLSLLLLNEPFTPSACVKVLDACESQPLPAIMGALELCHSDIWGGIMAREVRLRVEGLLGAFGEMLLDVKRKVEGGVIEVLAMEREREKTLASTGLVWGACDGLVELEKMGLVGLTVWKVEEFRGMLVDAIGELKEWGEDEEDLDEGFVGSEGDGGDDGDEFEDMFSAANKLPSHRRDLRELLEESLRELKLVDMLYKAMTKRRIKTFPVKTPPLEEDEARAQVKTLDEVVALLKSIPESVDDLANAFYELDAEEATFILTKITTDAKAVATKVEKSWTNTSDEFTTWRIRFEEALSKQLVKEEEGNAKRTMTLPLRSN